MHNRSSVVHGLALWCCVRARGYSTKRRCCCCCRFDPVYVVYFKTNKYFIKDYPNMREYVKELYALLQVCCCPVDGQSR